MDFEPTIASISLGHPTVHSITARLTAAAQHGFKQFEIVEADIIEQTKVLGLDTSPASQIKAAESIRALCDELETRVCVLQPFWFYEGLVDRAEHQVRIEKLELWMKLAAALGTQIVQIPSNWMRKGITGDVNVIVQDLTVMAEMGLRHKPVISFAYEAVAWGTHIDTWQGSWDIVQRVGRPNFGLCLDTYHIAARVWGDPTAESGKNENADQALEYSIAELVKEANVQKIFYVQPGDAERLDRPLVRGHPYYDEDQLPRMSWSRNARLFLHEQDRGGCLPAAQIVEAIVNELGYRGILSSEMFSRNLFNTSSDIPIEYARRGAQSWKKMIEELNKKAPRS